MQALERQEQGQQPNNNKREPIKRRITQACILCRKKKVHIEEKKTMFLYCLSKYVYNIEID
jgi:hypothetical protein